MSIVIGAHLLVAVEADWYAISRLVRPTPSLVDNMGGLDVNTALLQAETTETPAADEHLGLRLDTEGHLRFLVLRPSLILAELGNVANTARVAKFIAVRLHPNQPSRRLISRIFRHNEMRDSALISCEAVHRSPESSPPGSNPNV